MNLLKLTSHTGKDLFINPHKLVAFRPTDAPNFKTEVFTDAQMQYFAVKESYAEIVDALKDI